MEVLKRSKSEDAKGGKKWERMRWLINERPSGALTARELLAPEKGCARWTKEGSFISLPVFREKFFLLFYPVAFYDYLLLYNFGKRKFFNVKSSNSIIWWKNDSLQIEMLKMYENSIKTHVPSQIVNLLTRIDGESDSFRQRVNRKFTFMNHQDNLAFCELGHHANGETPIARLPLQPLNAPVFLFVQRWIHITHFLLP